ncbi:MAG: hypothetical protein R3A51_18820, partial [Nannocystaceae bacterium]
PTGDALVLVTDDSTLADGGLSSLEPVVLRDARGAVVSTYRLWTDPEAAPNPATRDDALVRDDVAAPDTPEHWQFAAPTPGAE